MGFTIHLDSERDLLYASGTHEHRPLGVAIIARESIFLACDFNIDYHIPARVGARYVGFYGSIGDINFALRGGRSKLRTKPTPGYLYEAAALPACQPERGLERFRWNGSRETWLLLDNRYA